MCLVEYLTPDGSAVNCSKHVIRLFCNDLERVIKAIRGIDFLTNSFSRLIGNRPQLSASDIINEWNTVLLESNNNKIFY